MAKANYIHFIVDQRQICTSLWWTCSSYKRDLRIAALVWLCVLPNCIIQVHSSLWFWVKSPIPYIVLPGWSMFLQSQTSTRDLVLHSSKHLSAAYDCLPLGNINWSSCVALHVPNGGSKLTLCQRHQIMHRNIKKYEGFCFAFRMI